ncbi:MAG: sorbosone dehydrogenase family protein [Steroidobacteraceae bacterium]
MRSKACLGAAIGMIAALSLSAACAAPAVDGLTLPAGFQIAPWVADIPNARSMARAEGGTVFVGTRQGGVVYAVRAKADGSREVLTIARGLDMPNGVAVRKGALYVAEMSKIWRYDDIEARLDAPPKPVLVAELPAERHHGWRYIAFGPDDKLYVAIGAPCNVCDRDKEGFATIVRMNPDGSGRETVARGVRNSVGFTWHPVTHELWFTDNGRDMLGDDVPSCELNRLGRMGEHFGFPFCHAGTIADPEFGKFGRCADTTPPVQALGPHVAPLGVHFYAGKQFPAAYRNQVFIAEHGSWNRSEKIGYRITLVKLDGNRAVSYTPFVSGWLKPDGSVSGRPVDLLELPDGSLLVSDDRAGAIYRISYSAS